MGDEESHTERRSWYWAMNCLQQPKPGVPATVARLKLHVAESILYSEGEAVADLKQAVEGHLREPIDVAWYSPIPLGHADKGQL